MCLLKFYKKYLEKKFPNLSVEALIYRIIELSTKNPSFIKVDPSIITILRKWVDNDNYVVSPRSNNRYESDS